MLHRYRARPPAVASQAVWPWAARRVFLEVQVLPVVGVEAAVLAHHQAAEPRQARRRRVAPAPPVRGREAEARMVRLPLARAPRAAGPAVPRQTDVPVQMSVSPYPVVRQIGES